MKKKNSEWFQHEALHTASIIANMFEIHLQEHPFIKQDKNLLKEANKIEDVLWEFYQNIGRAKVSKR